MTSTSPLAERLQPGGSPPRQDDHFDARGTGGAGLHFTGPTVITGGEGRRRPPPRRIGSGLDRRWSQERPAGRAAGRRHHERRARRRHHGRRQRSRLDDQAAQDRDTFNGKRRKRTFFAQDDPEADIQISGGNGSGYRAHRYGPRPDADRGRDRHRRRRTAAERRRLRTTRPRRRSARRWTPADKRRCASSDGEIHFGETPPPAARRRLPTPTRSRSTGRWAPRRRSSSTSRAGAFAQGATAETGTSEIEISALLGDVARPRGRPRHYRCRRDLDRPRGPRAEPGRRRRPHLLAPPCADRSSASTGPTINGRGGSGAGATYTGVLCSMPAARATASHRRLGQRRAVQEASAPTR